MTASKRKSDKIATPAGLRTPPSNTTPGNDHKSAKRIKSEILESPTKGKDTETKQNRVDNSAFGQIVFVHVGPERIRYNIHEGVLRRLSAWFKNALDSISTDIEGQNEHCEQPKTINLPDEDPEIFRGFNQWIYTQKLCTAAETPKELPWSTIFHIYTFAERRGIPKLQNSCIDVILRKAKHGAPFPTQEMLNPLWKTTGKVAPLRWLLLELFAAKCDLKAALGRNGGLHHRFLHDLVIILYEMKEGDLEEEPDFWKMRHKYYVSTPENPVALD